MRDLHADRTCSPQAGLTGSAELLVAIEHTAPSIGNGLVPVLATPVMINVIEAAALSAVEVEARDDKEPIGDGSHQWVVINVARSHARVQKRLGL